MPPKLSKQKKKQRNEHLKSIARSGGLARMQQLRDSGQLTQFQRRGAITMIEKYGRAKLAAKVAEWRRSHPSGPEMELHSILSSLGFDVIKSAFVFDGAMPLTAWVEHQPYPDDDIRPYILDVAWPPLKIALEVDGPVHTIFDTPQKQAYTTLRRLTLERDDWKVFTVASQDLHNDYGMSIIMECVELVRECVVPTTKYQPYITEDEQKLNDVPVANNPFNIEDVPF